MGTQYRSGIYVESAAHEAVARQVLAQAQAAHGGRGVTEVQPLSNNTRAEGHHQHCFANNPGPGYCAVVVAPKLEKFMRTFKARLKA